MPDPREPSLTVAAGRQVIELLKRSQGRAFVLFTSYASLRAVQAIAEMALDYPMFVQGTAPRSQLLTQNINGNEAERIFRTRPMQFS